MANQVATATITASSSISATSRAHYAGHDTIQALASLACNATEGVKLGFIPSTAGFGGITVDPTSYVYGASQAILAAIADASNGASKARAILVMGPLPYVEIYGVAGSALNLRTGGTNSTLSQQYMITSMGVAITPYTTTLWSAVANFLFNNPKILHADGFQATATTTSEGASVLDMLP